MNIWLISIIVGFSLSLLLISIYVIIIWQPEPSRNDDKYKYYRYKDNINYIEDKEFREEAKFKAMYEYYNDNNRIVKYLEGYKNEDIYILKVYI